MHAFLRLLQWLQQTSFSTQIRESTLVFPLLEGTHVLALAFTMAPVMMYDLRLIGLLWRTEPVSKIKAQFLPITVIGFLISLITGTLLFCSEPVKCFGNVYFRAKVILLILAGLNVLIFHSTIDRRLEDWDLTVTPPLRARLAGAASLVLWVGVIVAGRYTAYNL
jgi:hypothetical protein